MGTDPTAAATPNAEQLGREFFAAIDARDPRRLRATLANHASFKSLPHHDLIRPADEIVAYFGTVVSSAGVHGRITVWLARSCSINPRLVPKGHACCPLLAAP